MRTLLTTKVLTVLALLFCLALLPGVHVLAEEKESLGQINTVRLWHSPTKTRVVFDTSASVTYQVFRLASPERLVVDIQNVDFKAELPSIEAKNAHLSGVRSGSPKDGVLRFVFELKTPLEAHSFTLKPNELYGYRLVLDLIELQEVAKAELSTIDEVLPVASNDGDIESAQANVEKLPPEPIVNDQPVAVIKSPKKAQKITIAIDAGHGGEDPGAIGHRGSREKKITLSIAERLKKIIDADLRMQAFLIRNGDYYIDLTRRRTMAKEQNADIFVSIHADAFTKKSANGLSVFALSQSGATSAMAKALAKKENASDLIGGVSLANKDPVLAKVLVDLSMTNTISESVNLGGRVLKELGKIGRLHSKRVEQASFVVLKSPDIPSILIETGFITNLAEEKKLRSSSYQKKIAKAVHHALGDYFEQTPYYSEANYSSQKRALPVSSKMPKQHKIVVGDSLSSIAFKYGTNVETLKKLNELRGNTVVLGRKLKLPAGSERGVTTSDKSFIHTVERGDSLSKISARYNVTIRSLKHLNGLTKNSVYKGQKIKVPGVSKVLPKKTRIKHRVTAGDTLSEIAEKYRVSIDSVMQENNMRSRTVRLGQTLKITR